MVGDTLYSQKGELDFVYQNEIWFDNVYRKNNMKGKVHDRDSKRIKRSKLCNSWRQVEMDKEIME